MASKFVFLCGEVFFILVLHKTYQSQLQQCQQHQKQNMLHKFWAQKLMKTKNCHVFNISSIKHRFFFQNLAIIKKYSVVHRPPVVLHRLPATGNSCGRHDCNTLPTCDDEVTLDTSFIVKGRVSLLLEHTLMILVDFTELPVGVWEELLIVSTMRSESITLIVTSESLVPSPKDRKSVSPRKAPVSMVLMSKFLKSKFSKVIGVVSLRPSFGELIWKSMSRFDWLRGDPDRELSLGLLWGGSSLMLWGE